MKLPLLLTLLLCAWVGAALYLTFGTGISDALSSWFRWAVQALRPGPGGCPLRALADGLMLASAAACGGGLLGAGALVLRLAPAFRTRS